MIRHGLAGLALACLGGGTAEAAEPSLCARLAGEATRLPATTWTHSGPEPLAAWLKEASPPSPPGQSSPTEAAIAADPRWLDRVYVSEGDAVTVDHLAGTSVYMVSHISGTASCQSLVLVEVQPSQPARELAAPFKVDGMELCYRRRAQFINVLGRPALVASGDASIGHPDRDYSIAPWTGKSWGRACDLTLRMRVTMAPGQHFCAPGASVCEAGQQVAEQLAKAYEADRTLGASLNPSRFSAGRKPDAAVMAALKAPLVERGSVGDFNLDLPVFGADVRRLSAMNTSFSNADPRRLPVFIDGRWWLAVVGRGGVGWREGEAILVALFAPPGRPTDAVAAYQFITGPAGLRDAVARDEQP